MNENIVDLFQPYALSQTLMLSNRIVMAPMTRNMANDDLVPTPQMVDYYRKRADAGLIITEGTIIRPDGRGFSHVPGIFTQQQIDGWRRVTEAVHARKGRIFMQAWHVGRVSHPYFLEGQLPLSSSATRMTQRVPRAKDLYFGESRAATQDEVRQLIDSYALAAKNAILAGFDGVEIHGANGYLVDQFLHYHTNHRLDEYGGSIENRARFALDVVKACGEMIGFDKVAIRLSPGAYVNEMMGDERDYDVFCYLLAHLNKLDIAYIHTGVNNHAQLFQELRQQSMVDFMRVNYSGTLISAGNYNALTGVDGIHQGRFDLLAIGRPFIANPDLIQRLKTQQPMRAYDESMLAELN
jgi:N-ethylmaleimide reductase